jgi:hypothetical protein
MVIKVAFALLLALQFSVVAGLASTGIPIPGGCPECYVR